MHPYNIICFGFIYMPIDYNSNSSGNCQLSACGVNNTEIKLSNSMIYFKKF